MTRLELMRKNQKEYAELEARIPAMKGLERRVAEMLTLKWIKGTKWMGGLGNRDSERGFNRLMAEGYTYEEIDNEFERQIAQYE